MTIVDRIPALDRLTIPSLLADASPLQLLIPVVLLTFISIFLAWTLYLLLPVLSASVGGRYSSFPFLKGDRGFFQFLSLGYENVTESESLWRNGYEKVSTTLFRGSVPLCSK